MLCLNSRLELGTSIILYLVLDHDLQGDQCWAVIATQV